MFKYDPSFSILYVMKIHDPDIEKVAAECGSMSKSWEQIEIMFGLNKPRNISLFNPVILTEGVWLKISHINFFDEEAIEGYFIRKVRCITNSDVFYDGIYPKISYSADIGSLNHVFKVGEYEIDCRKFLPHEQQSKLLEFIKQTTGITDKPYPDVPNGIIKIPDLLGS